MKSIEDGLKEYKYETIFTSILMVVIGVIMIFFSKSFLNIVSYLIGIILIISGIVKIYCYFSSKGKSDILNYDLSFGILNIILGILCIIFKSQVQSIFRIVIGLIIIYEGVLNISLATKIFNVDKMSGVISLILSALIILSGFLVIFTKGLVVTTVGTILIVFAIMNIVECIIFNKNLKKLKKYLSN